MLRPHHGTRSRYLSVRNTGSVPTGPGRRHNPFGHGETSYAKSGVSSPGVGANRPAAGTVSALRYLSMLSREDRSVEDWGTGRSLRTHSSTLSSLLDWCSTL